MTEYIVVGNSKKTSIAFTIMIVLVAISLIFSIGLEIGYLADGLMIVALVAVGIAMKVYDKRGTKIVIDNEKLLMYSNIKAGKPKYEMFFQEIKLLRANGDRIIVSDGLTKLIEIPFLQGKDYEYLNIYNILREKARVTGADVKSNFDHTDVKKVNVGILIKGYYAFLIAVFLYLVSTFIYTAIYIEEPSVTNYSIMIVMSLLFLSYWAYLFYNISGNKAKSAVIIRKSWVSLYVTIVSLLFFNMLNIDGHEGRGLAFWVAMLIFPIFYRMFIVNYVPRTNPDI